MYVFAHLPPGRQIDPELPPGSWGIARGGLPSCEGEPVARGFDRIQREPLPELGTRSLRERVPATSSSDFVAGLSYESLPGDDRLRRSS